MFLGVEEFNRLPLKFTMNRYRIRQLPLVLANPTVVLGMPTDSRLSERPGRRFPPGMFWGIIAVMPTQATYDDANLILKLFELRREEKMRQARQWFATNFTPTSIEDAQKLIAPGTQENAYFRMVVSYWEMVASFVTSGVLNQELFFESGGELLFVWERVRELLPSFRAASKNPIAWKNLENRGEPLHQAHGSLWPGNVSHLATDDPHRRGR